ncbi:hypothetical protein [Sabulicella glaciei]|uniref:hypothetical protein n=1 Tax=Sabulicella glaciei TaxID=2984948 RepID=UPI0026587AEE|nr:hypothetical protein [Roseococcus sp. MDT2-1-1]
MRRGYSALEKSSPEEIAAYFEAVDSGAVRGHINNIKGILFEQEYVEALEAAGTHAAMFEATNHPVTDIMVFGGLNDVSEIQLKATDSVSYVTSAVNEHPEILFAVTSEVATKIGDAVVVNTGIENSALEQAIEEALFAEAVNPFSALSALRFLIGIPF